MAKMPQLDDKNAFEKGREHLRSTRVLGRDVNALFAGLRPTNDKFKREDFSRDAGKDEQRKLLDSFERASDFCLNRARANCFLIDKDFTGEDASNIAELVDLKFLHHVQSRVTIRDRVHRLYDAYMLDLS